MTKLRTSLIVLILFAGIQAPAQYVVHLVLDRLPAYHEAGSTVYVAGSFNQWNPADSNFRFINKDGRRMITLRLPKGIFFYKLTRGSWSKSEATPAGKGAENRMMDISSDTSIQVSVENWTDHFPSEAPKSTASRNVQVVDTAFFMPQLNRRRRIWIYLPENYDAVKKKYPVLYMQDGQNLFDQKTSAFGEWGIDEILDRLGSEIIVVGIDNGARHRTSEYSPFDMDSLGKGEGKAYANFMVQTLKPFIDKHYRTLRSSKHTFVAGSSMGGLISIYAILEHPRTFGAAGVFSPAFWTSSSWKSLDPHQLKKVKGRIYLYAGREESDEMVPDLLNVLDQLQRHSKAKVEAVIRSNGRHNEATWGEVFPHFYNWLLKK